VKEQKRTPLKKRRVFLKKAVYHAPVLYALGQLAKPPVLHADATGGPDGPPGGGDPFLAPNESASQPERRDAPKKRDVLKF